MIEILTLFELANFVPAVATSGVEDVRTVLEYYNQFDDPIAAFKENQRKLQVHFLVIIVNVPSKSLCCRTALTVCKAFMLISLSEIVIVENDFRNLLGQVSL